MSESQPPASELPPMLRGWLGTAIELGASDLHVVPGYPPVVRLHGDLIELPGDAVINGDETGPVLLSLCSAEAAVRLERQRDIDLAFETTIQGRTQRFRVNLFHTGRELAACLRLIPTEIPDFAWAGFPVELAERLAFLRDGLVIFSGATGSGKTTTLAMIINLMIQTGGFRIITVEEPIEYVFPKRAGSVVSQREVGMDVPTFADGLKYGLRQDPDVILVGEIRDRDTAAMALSAAETGHLVFSTLHTRDAKGALTRFPDLFPSEAQRDVRGQLALSLRAIVAQRLLPDPVRGAKRHLAIEVLWNTHAIASAIRTGKVESIDNYLVTGRAEGMIAFDESVRVLMRSGRITRSVAEQHVNDVSILNR